MKRCLVVLAIAGAACGRGPADPELARMEQRARNVTIVRDDWGIAHVRGRSDADAVFGMIYAQAEDDFNRVEMNYVTALGRAAEVHGDSLVFSDLRMKLFVRPDSLRALFAASPAWLRDLMTAWADGLNYYLATHPAVTPRLLTRFEPWMPLAFSEGSIGGDIETISVRDLRAFYEAAAGRSGGEVMRRGGEAAADAEREPSGSNGIAIAPALTASGHAMLLINPHTSFFFRSELQITSDSGLNAYGAVTWGQFFIYQGFNERTGWMHTSSNADAIDEYEETIVRRGDSLFYRHGAALRAVLVDTIVVPYRTDSAPAHRMFTVYRTHHGPVVRSRDGRWITVRLMHDPVTALTQSYARTKARNYQEFRATMDLHTNSSNNTVYADADGSIAYFHANHIPRRDPRFDWTQPVDGSDPRTEWGGALSVAESPHLLNPPNGWLQNTNNWPWSAAGADSPRREDYPVYVESGTENWRGVHAVRVLEGRRAMTLDSLIAAAYDSHLPAFDSLLPPLFAAFDALPAAHPLRARTAEQVELLRAWDRRWGATSVPTTLAVFWAEALSQRTRDSARGRETSTADMLARSTPLLRVQALAAASDTLTASFGTWRTPWGDINRFQRLTADIEQPFADTGASIPVPFTSARWGSLASFGARARPGTYRWYGTSGNSFVAVVEFGDSVRARAITAGGLSGNTASPHFNDQAARYAGGDLRAVYFYPGQLRGHTEREYRPGR